MVPLPEAAGPSMAMIMREPLPLAPCPREALRAGRRDCRDGKAVAVALDAGQGQAVHVSRPRHPVRRLAGGHHRPTPDRGVQPGV